MCHSMEKELPNSSNRGKSYEDNNIHDIPVWNANQAEVRHC
jgi:hypothetical protein